MGGSSSHRRKARAARSNRASRPSPKRTPAVPVPPTQRTLNFDDLAISSGRGYDLLLKSGWSPGSTLGPSPCSTADSTPTSLTSLPSTSRTPLTAPLPITLRRGRAGLGVALPAPDPAPATPPQQLDHVDHSPPLVRSLAALSVFDPLRPRCQYDASHVVRDLKALRKHELSCPANPARRFAQQQQQQQQQQEHASGAHPAFASRRAQAALSAALAEGHHAPGSAPNFATGLHAQSALALQPPAFAPAPLHLAHLSDSELSDSDLSRLSSDEDGDDAMDDVEAGMLQRGGASDADEVDMNGVNDSDSDSDDDSDDDDAMHVSVPGFRLART